uniref:leucine-rich repeat and IQ domain-containing protein 1 isoform X2 n=1 Tax=Doryrhamphus excisus TaxID=161450 RepID=UPI0025AE213D|nr:leucine-rich repeat and IQ domain-containing protein 1 isoform X2 [Doryrhamphus excisus]
MTEENDDTMQEALLSGTDDEVAEDEASDEIPASLLSYFEASRKRLEACEKIILDDLEGLTASTHNEETTNQATLALTDEDTKTPADLCGAQNEDDSASTDASLHADEDVFSTDSQGEGEAEDCETSLVNEEGQKKSDSQEDGGERALQMEIERRRQGEQKFEEKLRRIMEVQKLRQKEVDWRAEQAQEKLEQEFHLQQELVNQLKRQVEEQLKTREEEQKRLLERKKEEEEMRKTEEKKRIEQEENRIQREEEEKRKEAERKQREEVRRKEDARKQIEEEEKKRMKEEEENRIWIEEKIRQREEEAKREEADRKLKEELSRIRKIEEKKMDEERRIEEKRKQMEEEEKKLMEEEMKSIEEKRKKSDGENERKKEKESKQVEERKREEAERMEMEEELRRKVEQKTRNEAAKKLKEEELMRKKEEDDGRKEADRRQIEEDEKEEEWQQNTEKKQKEEEEKTRKEEDEMMRNNEGKHLKEEKWKKRDDEPERVERGTSLKNDKDEVGIDDNEEKMMKDEQEEERMKQEDERRTWREKEACGKDRRNKTIGECEQKKVEEDEGVTVMEEDEPQEKKAEQPRKDAWMIKSDEKITDEDKTRKEEKNECGRRGGEHEDSDGQKNNKEEGEEVRKMKEVEDFFKTKVVISKLEAEQAPTHLHPPASQPQHDHNTPLDSSHQTGTTSPIAQLVEQRRLSWLKSCVFWSQLSRQNRSRLKGSVGTRREFRRSAETSGLPPLCPNILKQVSGRSSLQELTTLVLEDLPGCSLSTLTQCARLQSLTLRRCGLKVLDSIKELPELSYVDVQQNQISRLDCDNMSTLRVLKLGYNKLMSIHGLNGAENLGLLELSHNSITRVAGLGSLRRLQQLSLDHNQLISTKGLKDLCTLLHLDCSHNHLASVEGLEDNVLLNVLDLNSNSLTEPPALHNHVLLRELHLDDNSISSLQGLAACWLPLLQTLTVAHNRLTHLPPMSAAVSLSNLDLRFNCLADVKNVCLSLEGCHSLKEVHLTGNPLQQESSWRSTLQRAISSLRTIDMTDDDFPIMDSSFAQQISPASDIFLNFIQVQLQQTRDLRQKHSEQLSKALDPLDTVKLTCQHLTETLRLAQDHRRAHECADISYDQQNVSRQSIDIIDEAEFIGKVSPITCNKETGRDFANSASEGKRTGLQMAAVSQNFTNDMTDTVLVQQLESKHKQRWNISSSFISEDRGGKTECGAPSSNVARHHAATVIQAHWRGFTWRRRLADALAAVTLLDTSEDDIFEVVDLDEFVFDEATLEQGWAVPLCDDLPARCSSVSKQPLLQQFSGSYCEHSQHVLPPLPVWRPTQAWGIKDQDDSSGKTVSPQRNKSASTSVASGLSERSEKILEEWGFTNPHTAELMLRRAQKMKSKKKSSGPSVHLVACRNLPLTTYPLCAIETPKRQRLRGNDGTKVLQAEACSGRAKQERTREWHRKQNTLKCSESEHFLPDIGAVMLSGGPPQRGAETAHIEQLHHTSGVWADSSLSPQPCRENKCARNTSVELQTKQDAPSSSRVPSAVRRKECISFRDETVRWSGGWGGGKKRDKLKHAHN